MQVVEKILLAFGLGLCAVAGSGLLALAGIDPTIGAVVGVAFGLAIFGAGTAS